MATLIISELQEQREDIQMLKAYRTENKRPGFEQQKRKKQAYKQ